MNEGQIRPIAIGIFRRDDQILVFEGYDPALGETFYRPLGGAIEFGEYGHQALAREVREEINAEVENLRYLGLSENLFECAGQQGHEIVLIYEGDLVGSAIYEQDVMTGREDDGSPFKVLWAPLARFRRGEAPLYPDGLLELLLADAGSKGDAT
jgi:ADP-ribose pyrophosphatase YjhB (NUDIX family)